MPDFTPTHTWRMRLGSAGDQSTPVVLVAVVDGDRGSLASVRTRGGNTYLAHTDELDPIEVTS